MNCKKCGKEIDYEAEVCNECVAAEASVEPVAEEVAAAEGVVAVNVADNKKGKMAGFGKALTSLLLPIIGAVLIHVIFIGKAEQYTAQTLPRFDVTLLCDRVECILCQREPMQMAILPTI